MSFNSRKYSRYKNRSSDFIIRVSPSDNTTFQGSIEHVQSGQSQFFRSFLEMLYLIEHKLDEVNYPQASTEIRSWKD